MFNVNFENIIYYLIPLFVRKQRFLAFLYSPIRTLIDKYNDFVAYRNETNYLLMFSSIIKELEYILNLKFNGGGTGIVIITNELSKTYTYNKSESQLTPYTYNKSEGHIPPYLRNKSENTVQYNFTVNVPVALQPFIDENELRGYVNFYKLAGMTYNINYV